MCVKRNTEHATHDVANCNKGEREVKRMREKPGQIWLSWFLTLFLFLSLVRPPPSFGCFFSQPEFIFSCRASVAVRRGSV